MSSPTQAIELHDPGREMQDLRGRLQALETQVHGLRVELKQQGESLRLAIAAVFHRVADELGGTAAVEPGAATQAGSLPSWFYAWESKLGKTAVKCLKALIECGSMTNQQVSMATGLASSTVPTGLQELQKAGLISRAGRIYSVKKGGN